jgi:hypothetical protein
VDARGDRDTASPSVRPSRPKMVVACPGLWPPGAGRGLPRQRGWSRHSVHALSGDELRIHEVSTLKMNLGVEASGGLDWALSFQSHDFTRFEEVQGSAAGPRGGTPVEDCGEAEQPRQPGHRRPRGAIAGPDVDPPVRNRRCEAPVIDATGRDPATPELTRPAPLRAGARNSCARVGLESSPPTISRGLRREPVA